MAIKRIHSDLAGVVSLASCGIFVYAHEDDITKMDAVIEGPVDTPYQGGFFYFKLKFPNDYPLSSPKVQLQTTGGGNVRFNPNLYACGKVCLSILGTWQGPSWTAGLTLSTVLLSIQSLMCEQPMKNEPGFERHHLQHELDAYNTIIRHETLRVAAFGNVKRILNGISEIPSELHWGILEGFQKHVTSGYYERTCRQNCRLDGQAMADPFGEARGHFNFDALWNECSFLATAQSLKPPSSSSAAAEAPVVDLSDDSHYPPLPPADNPSAPESMTLVEEEEVEVSDGLKCGICYEVLATAGVLECGHTFCYLCAHKWLMKKSLCPTCRETCQLDNLRRIFNLDSLCEGEAKRVLGAGERYASWSARKSEGIELANGKRLETRKKKSGSRHSYFNGDEDDDDMSQEDEDEYAGGFNSPGMGMGIGGMMGAPQHPYGQQTYFGGAGHVLGTAPPPSLALSEEEAELQQVLEFIKAENAMYGHPAAPAASSSSSSSTSHLDPQQLHELRLKKFAATSSSSSAPPPVQRTAPAPLSISPMAETETAYARAQREKQQKEFERKRLRLEIARDKEERKQNSGVLPPTHETVLYSKSDSSQQILRAVEIPSSSASSSTHQQTLTQPRSERVDSSLETICRHAGQDCTTLCWRETETALTVLSKILANIDEHPEETKYRSINTASKVFKEKLVRVNGVQIFLFSLGFNKVSSVDASGAKQTNYTLAEYDMDLLQETRTKLLLALERFR
jgi:ubiquitin-conjugating enzyme E2 Z